MAFYIFLFLFIPGLVSVLCMYLKVEILMELLPAAEKQNKSRIKKLLIHFKPLFRPFRQSLHYRFDSQFKFSFADISKKAARFISDFKEYNQSEQLPHIPILDIILAGRQKLRIEKLEWKTIVGLENAMDIAICTGSIWAIKGGLIGLISANNRLQKMTIDVQADFSEIKFASRLHCIVKMRSVHIIIIVARLLLHSLSADNRKRKPLYKRMQGLDIA